MYTANILVNTEQLDFRVLDNLRVGQFSTTSLFITSTAIPRDNVKFLTHAVDQHLHPWGQGYPLLSTCFR